MHSCSATVHMHMSYVCSLNVLEVRCRVAGYPALIIIILVARFRNSGKEGISGSAQARSSNYNAIISISSSLAYNSLVVPNERDLASWVGRSRASITSATGGFEKEAYMRRDIYHAM